MVDDDVQYDFKSVRAVRGTEARSIAKWQKAGWELVDQSPGPLRTTLNFRRVKPKLPWLPIAALGGVALLIAVVVGIVSAVQSGDDKAPASTASAATASQNASETVRADASRSSEPTVEQTLTRKNNAEFAALLAVPDYCDDTIEPFAAKYADRTVGFDGSIVTMAKHDDYKTRYDILLAPGDKGPKSVRGPAFKFEDVNVSDLHLTGANVPETVSPGLLVRVVARVGDYSPNQCLFFLDPVSTEIR